MTSPRSRSRRRGIPSGVSNFLNIRVADILAVYAEWSARGAEFLTPPKLRKFEIRCYIPDPGDDLVEVGQNHLPGRGLVGMDADPSAS